MEPIEKRHAPGFEEAGCVDAAFDRAEPISALQKFEQIQGEIVRVDQKIAARSSDKGQLIDQGLDKNSNVISQVDREIEDLRIEKREITEQYEASMNEMVRELFLEDKEKRAAYETERTKRFTPEEIAEMEQEIKEIYDKKPLWHGTGRFRYGFKGQSKYDGVDYDAPHVDVLKSILTTGLCPQYDPWGESSSGSAATLSLSEQRMLARVVGEARLPEGETFGYEFGSSRFWWLLLTKKEGLEHLSVHKGALSATITSMSELNRNVHETKTNNYIDIYTGTRSTIENNYPVLFALKRDVVHAAPLKGIAVSRDFEQRSVRASGVDSISHIEVPLKNMEETKALLRELQIDILVIPIEEWELFSARLAEKTFEDKMK